MKKRPGLVQHFFKKTNTFKNIGRNIYLTMNEILTGSIEVFLCLKTKEDFCRALMTTRFPDLASVTNKTFSDKIDFILNDLRSRMLPNSSKWGILFVDFLGDAEADLFALSRLNYFKV